MSRLGPSVYMKQVRALALDALERAKKGDFVKRDTGWYTVEDDSLTKDGERARLASGEGDVEN